MPKLKHTDRFAVGARIRGYDFPNRKDCYLQGIVIDPDHTTDSTRGAYRCYRITVEKQVVAGEEVTLPCDEGYIPHEVSFFEYEGRIEEIKGQP